MRPTTKLNRKMLTNKFNDDLHLKGIKLKHHFLYLSRQYSNKYLWDFEDQKFCLHSMQNGNLMKIDRKTEPKKNNQINKCASSESNK